MDSDLIPVFLLLEWKKPINLNPFFLLLFQEGSNYGSRRIARGPIMEIDNVRRGDAGTYMCTASNNVGTMSADEIDLRVLCKFFEASKLKLKLATKERKPTLNEKVGARLRKSRKSKSSVCSVATKGFLKRYFIDHNLLLRTRFEASRITGLLEIRFIWILVGRVEFSRLGLDNQDINCQA